MNATIEGTAFNGIKVGCQIELYLDGVLRFAVVKERQNLLSDRVYTEARTRVLELLHKALPKLKIETVAFSIVSRDLQNMKSAKITPDPAQLSRAVSDTVLQFIFDSLHIDSAKSMSQRLKKLSAKSEDFAEIFLGSSNLTGNSDLLRAGQLFVEKKYPESFKLLVSIAPEDLTISENRDFNFLQFALLLKNSSSNSESLEKAFSEQINLCQSDPRQAKQFYFAYLRFLEDCREVRLPRELIKEFEQKYPVSILDNSELSLYHYLKGRAEYGRGEFLDALKLLSRALETIDKDDKKMVATIFNTAVNSFTDNLFFDEADYIANKALVLRELLDLPERQESLSCLGGIAFKRGDFVQAFSCYSQAETLAKSFTLTSREQNRLYNYLAKTSLMMENFEVADKYLEKAKECGDFMGFSAAVEMFGALQKRDFSGLNELYQTTFMLPENHRDFDSFALAWGYAFMAQAAFLQAAFRDGVIYLFDAVNFFLDDNYILEAAYITLYLCRYSVPQKYIETFRKLETDLFIVDRLTEYVEKHSSIRETFFTSFCDEEIGSVPESSHLQIFYDDFISLDDDNCNPEVVKKIMDSFYLL